ncbi:hypothetical protein C8F01DRAFT_1370554 [Mycena amicta]|nr:hypothetical protein C8F01DRAFT_1370554 [Mycena amicta]
MTDSRFPNELWLDILKHLPKANMKPLASTSRTLMALTRPLLFDHFAASFCVPDGEAHCPSSPSDTAKRLQFLASPDIAPLIKTCTAGCSMNDIGSIGIPVVKIALPGEDELRTHGCEQVIEFLLQNIHLFTGLKRLTLFNPILCDETVSALQLAASGKDLKLRVNVYTNPPLFGNNNFTVQLPLAAFSLRGMQRYTPWIQLLDATRLSALHITCDTEALDMSQLAVFKGLTQLHLEVYQSADDGLEFNDLPLLSDDTFPLLKDFIGPPDLASEFLAHCPLHRLTVLHGDLQDWPARLQAVVPEERRAALRMLDLDQVGFTHPQLRDSLALFPNVVQLVVSNCSYWSQGGPNDMFSMTIPTNMFTTPGATYVLGYLGPNGFYNPDLGADPNANIDPSASADPDQPPAPVSLLEALPPLLPPCLKALNVAIYPVVAGAQGLEPPLSAGNPNPNPSPNPTGNTTDHEEFITRARAAAPDLEWIWIEQQYPPADFAVRWMKLPGPGGEVELKVSKDSRLHGDEEDDSSRVKLTILPC